MNPHWGWVTDRLATGDDEYTTSPRIADMLYEAGITHIVDCCDSAAFSPDVRMEYLHHGTKDDGNDKVAWMESVLPVVLNILCNPNAKVYVHCAAGVNRGPSVAYGVLRVFGYNMQDSFRAVLRARPDAHLAYADDADRALYELGFLSSRA